MTAAVVDKYLRAHAEPEAAAVSLPRAAAMRHVVCVVAHGEGPGDLELLQDLPASGATLLVLLLNDRTDSDPGAIERGRALHAHLVQRYGAGVEAGPGASAHTTPFGGLLVMRRTADTSPLPADQGVGLARKIACDAALSLVARGQIAAEVLHVTDADARLPADYVTRVTPRPGTAFAAVYPFEHVGGDAPLHAAGQLYELWLRCYVLGLQRAGSPYAMHTIGSTLAISTRGYASVRGIPRRHGAEDFYALAKLAKVGPIERLAGAPIRLRDRLSTRVPLGTGPGVRRILEGQPPAFHHPRSFELLGDFLRGLDRLALDGGRGPWPDLASVLCPGLPPDAGARVVERSGIEGALRAAGERPDAAGRCVHLHTYFDALRTLKWLRALPREGLGEVGWWQAVSHLLPTLSPAAIPDALEGVRALEASQCRGEVGLTRMALASAPA